MSDQTPNQDESLELKKFFDGLHSRMLTDKKKDAVITTLVLLIPIAMMLTTHLFPSFTLFQVIQDEWIGWTVGVCIAFVVIWGNYFAMRYRVNNGKYGDNAAEAAEMFHRINSESKS